MSICAISWLACEAGGTWQERRGGLTMLGRGKVGEVGVVNVEAGRGGAGRELGKDERGRGQQVMETRQVCRYDQPMHPTEASK